MNKSDLMKMEVQRWIIGSINLGKNGWMLFAHLLSFVVIKNTSKRVYKFKAINPLFLWSSKYSKGYYLTISFVMCYSNLLDLFSMKKCRWNCWTSCSFQRDFPLRLAQRNIFPFIFLVINRRIIKRDKLIESFFLITLIWNRSAIFNVLDVFLQKFHGIYHVNAICGTNLWLNRL